MKIGCCADCPFFRYRHHGGYVTHDCKYDMGPRDQDYSIDFPHKLHIHPDCPLPHKENWIEGFEIGGGF